MILKAVLAGWFLRSAMRRAGLSEWGAFWVHMMLGLGLIVMAYNEWYAPCRI